MMSKVSVIVPVYNVEKYLKRCLDSLLEQTLQDIEIILVNDGSSDNSENIIKTYLDKFHDIRVINQGNQGLSEARNVGIELARSKYITFVDSDDVIDKTMLEKLYTEAENSDADIVSSSHQIKINDEINLFNADYISLDKQAFFENILSCRVSNMACGRLYKRDLFTKYNCFFPKGAFYEDVATLYKLAFYAKTVVYIDEPLYIYHSMREGSISASFDIKKVNDLFEALESTQSFLISQDIYKKYLGLYVERFAKQIFSKFNRIESQGLKDIVIQKIVDLDIFNDKNLNAVAKTDYMTYSLIQVFIIENIYKHDSDLKADLFKKLFFDVSKKCVFKAINRESLGYEDLRNKYNSESCFIFSKPFIFDAQTKVQLEQVYTFGIHEAIFSNFVTNFYFSIGANFTIKNSDRIKKYNADIKLLPSFASYLYKDEDNSYFFNDYEKHVSSMSSKKCFEFSYNPFEYLDASFGSIIAGLQMAYYLGFKRVYLVDIHFNTQESRMVYAEIERIYQQSNREILLLDATDVVHSIL